MQTFYERLLLFLSLNKRLLIPLVPLVLFVILFIFLALQAFFVPPATNPPQVLPQPTLVQNQVPTVSGPSPTPDEESGSDAHADLDIYANSENLQKTETLPDGTIQYTLTSPVAARPDIVILNPQNDQVMFERSVRERDGNTLLSQYIGLYGQPERTVNGSRFYGQTAQTLIYATQGLALIANPTTGSLFELHTFSPTTVETYIQKYGGDIPVSPTP